MIIATAAMTAPGDKPVLVILGVAVFAAAAWLAVALLVSRRREKRSTHQPAHRR